MKVDRTLYYNFFIYILLLGVPFSYISFFGIRILPIFSLSFLFILFASKRIIYSFNMIIFSLLISCVFFMSIIVIDFTSLYAMIIFFIMAYWPFALDKYYISEKYLDSFIDVYIKIGFLMAFGVIIQSFLFNKFGLKFGKIDEMYERVGFGFIWSDYSFFSLYLTSLIPLVWYKRNLTVSFIYSFFLLVASLVTTARSGFYGLLIFVIILVLCSLFKKVFILDRINLKKIFFGLIFVGVGYFILSGLFVDRFSRALDLDSSDRIDGYYGGFNYFLNNIIFGSYYSIDLYKIDVGTIPHNIFIYNLVLGGIVFFVFFVFWFLSILSNIFLFKNRYISFSLIISLIGFQFIPAVFTAYFFAFLLSLMFYANRLENQVRKFN